MKMGIENEIFNFWKENKLTGFFQLTADELKTKFQTWLPRKDINWIDYYGIDDCINEFISVELNAVGNSNQDFAEYKSMAILLKPIRENYLSKNIAP